MNKNNICDYYKCIINNPNCSVSGRAMESKVVSDYMENECNIKPKCGTTKTKGKYSSIDIIPPSNKPYDTSFLLV